jgi:hypothetical protein
LRKGKTANLKKSRPKGEKSGGGKAKQRVQKGVEKADAGDDDMDIDADDREPGNVKTAENVGRKGTRGYKEVRTREEEDGAVKMAEDEG